jgi:TolB protein
MGADHSKRHVLTAAAACAALVALGALPAVPAHPAVAGEPGRLVFVTTVFGGVLDDGGRNHMYTVRPDGTGLRRLTDGREEPQLPRWAPFGGRIVYEGADRAGNRRGIWVMNADGTHRRRVPGSRFSGQADWAPHGAHLVFAPGGHGSSSLAIYSFATHTTRFVDLGEPGLGAGSPTWSPDGRRIAFVAGGTEGGPHEDDGTDLYTIRPNGTGLTRVRATPRFFEDTPDWSPNGRRLLYQATATFEDFTGLYTIKLDGSDRRRIPAGWYADSPVWGPAGARIAAYRATPRRPGVWVMRRDGSGQRWVADGFMPDWQPRRR